MTNCWYCGTPMIWGSDYNVDEVLGVGEDTEGIATILSCPNCKAECIFYIIDEDEEKEEE